MKRSATFMALTALVLSCLTSRLSGQETDAATAARWADEWKTWEAKQAKVPKKTRALELNGDRLGMTLEMFKGKHYRGDKSRSSGHLPNCSDQKPDEADEYLRYTPDLAKMGIVNAATTMPKDESADNFKAPTVADVEMEHFVYQFVDGKLFQISTRFKHDDFERVKKALISKYGKPVVSRTAPGGGGYTGWSNGSYSLTLSEFAAKQRDRSSLQIGDTKLQEMVIKRRTSPNARDK
jgi:hypothetical protein